MITKITTWKAISNCSVDGLGFEGAETVVDCPGLEDFEMDSSFAAVADSILE